MSQTINCPSCGAANQLPEGKNSMFYAFCGNSIIASVSEKKTNESSIKTKPQISNTSLFNVTTGNIIYRGHLSLTNKNINSLDEISSWLSDDELSSISNLVLKNNKIKNLDGLERFLYLETIDLINNEIYQLPEKNKHLQKISKVNLAGNPIEKTITQEQKSFYPNINFSLLKNRVPVFNQSVSNKIKMDYKDENIQNLNEIIDLYSDDELAKIDIINFSNNKINTLKGLSRFSATDIDFSNNDLISIDELPNFKRNERYERKIDLHFTNNKNLKEFTDKALEKLYSVPIEQVFLNIKDCNNFNYESLCKINFNKIIYSTDYELSSFTILLAYTKDPDPNIMMPASLKQIGFIKSNYNTWVLPRKGHPNYKSSGCFIATATMGSYEHPTVKELRYFRDNWILQKSWGESFVNCYYHYGAIAAKFIEKSFMLKKISYLLIVKPLYILSKILKK